MDTVEGLKEQLVLERMRVAEADVRRKAAEAAENTERQHRQVMESENRRLRNVLIDFMRAAREFVKLD